MNQILKSYYDQLEVLQKGHIHELLDVNEKEAALDFIIDLNPTLDRIRCKDILEMIISDRIHNGMQRG
jgi:hypothetical protein